MSNKFFTVGTYKIHAHQSYAYYLKVLKGLIKFNKLDRNHSEFSEMLHTTLPFLRDGQTLRSWYKLRSAENLEFKLIHCINHILKTIVECSCNQCVYISTENQELSIQVVRTLVFETISRMIDVKTRDVDVELYWNTVLINSKDINKFVVEEYQLQPFFKFNNNLLDSLVLQSVSGNYNSSISLN